MILSEQDFTGSAWLGRWRKRPGTKESRLSLETGKDNKTDYPLSPPESYAALLTL